VKVAGAGSDGAQTAAMLLAKTAVNEGYDATHIPSYGPESRGGTSFADVRIAAREVLSPDVAEPDVLVAFNLGERQDVVLPITTGPWTLRLSTDSPRYGGRGQSLHRSRGNRSQHRYD
jgi:hypothetical protein